MLLRATASRSKYRGSVNNASTGAHRANLSPAHQDPGHRDRHRRAASRRLPAHRPRRQPPRQARGACAWTVLCFRCTCNGLCDLSAAQLTSLLSRCDRSLPVITASQGKAPKIVPQVHEYQMSSVMNRHVSRPVALLESLTRLVHPVHCQVNFTAFSAAAAAAFNMTLSPPFDAFTNDVTFLLGAFLFEDIGVTAYKVRSLFTINLLLQASQARGRGRQSRRHTWPSCYRRRAHV